VSDGEGGRGAVVGGDAGGGGDGAGSAAERFRPSEHPWLIVAVGLGLVAGVFVVWLAALGVAAAQGLIVIVVVGLAIIAFGTRMRG